MASGQRLIFALLASLLAMGMRTSAPPMAISIMAIGIVAASMFGVVRLSKALGA